MSNASQSSQHSPKTPIDYPDKSSMSDLPKALFWDSFEICQWQGFWFSPSMIEQAMTFGSDFKPRDDDVLLASSLKTGTTWLKSLMVCFTKSKRDNNNAVTTDFEEDILTKENPHLLLPTIETKDFFDKPLQELWKNIFDENPTNPRLMHTHLPYTVLPESLKNSRCKIVYVARNPKDTVISIWHFFNSFLRKDQEPYPLSKLVDCFCSGVIQYGPFFDHVLEYWLQSKRSPEKILFVKYEEMKSDPKERVRKIAEFLGECFESEAEIDEILWRCSFDRLKSLEVNNRVILNIPSSAFFRKGLVGDSKNYLTREMEEKIDRMSRDKFEPHGLFF